LRLELDAQFKPTSGAMSKERKKERKKEKEKVIV